MSNYIIVNGELYHHGIKGQRWGIRRFQKKDGSLTPAGKKRYDDGNDSSNNVKKKSKYRENLENKYMEKGLTRENAVKAANDKIRTQKILGVVGAVTVAAAGAYLVNRHIKERTDGAIKSGETMQRIEGVKKIFGKDRNLHDSFYITNNSYDNKNYKDAFGNQKKNYYGKAYELQIKAKDDIKIASQKKARDALKELLTNDEFMNNTNIRDFTSDLRGNHKVDKRILMRVAKGKWVPESTMRKLYDNFNSNLVGKPRDSAEKKSRSMFYDALKKQGYGGVQDINDLKWSLLRGKNPLIIFDKSKVSVDKIVDITDQMSRVKEDKAYYEMSKLVGKQAAWNAIPKIAQASVVGLGLTFLPEGRKDTRRRLIKQYKHQHPNTVLSDKEIARMLTEKK